MDRCVSNEGWDAADVAAVEDVAITKVTPRGECADLELQSVCGCR